MNWVESLFSAPVWHAASLALLHSLWIGILISFALALLLALAPAHRAELRYRLALAALLGLFASTTLLFSVLWRPRVAFTIAPVVEMGADRVAGVVDPNVRNLVSTHSSSITPATSQVQRSNWLSWIAAIWSAGSGFMLVRLIGQWISLQEQRKAFRPIQEDRIMRLLAECVSLMRIRKSVLLLHADAVFTPAVYGIFLPTLVLPTSCLTGIPLDHLRAIFLHELAHIRRHDFLINLLQEMIQSFFFFNPAAWWINQQIRREREACCDLIAVENLGEKVTYAQVLVDWAGRLQAPALAQYFADSPAPLLERLKRLLVPATRLPVRLPWSSFSGGLAICALFLVLLWGGTRGAFLVAAKLLTPAQRVKKIQELTAQISPMTREYGEKDYITITGNVRTEDGSPLPGQLNLASASVSPSTRALWESPLNHGSFSNHLDYGTLYLEPVVAGVPRGLVGPLQANPGGSLSNIDVVISNGVPATLQITSIDGTSIADVTIEGGYEHGADVSSAHQWKSSVEGKVRFDHWLGCPLHLRLEVPHFQFQEFSNVMLSPDSITAIRLSPARRFQARVVAKDGGAPISGAEILFLARGGKYPFRSGFFDARRIAVTDESGDFELNTLPESNVTTLIVRKEGFAPAFWRNVQPGQTGLEIALEKQFVLQGSISGKLSGLGGFPRTPVVRVQATVNPFMESDQFYSTSHDYPVTINEGVGYFSITNLFLGRFVLFAGNVRKEVQLSRDTPFIKIDLNDKPAPAPLMKGPEREVIFSFKVPENAPPPSGAFSVTYYREEDAVGRSTNLVFTNGEARLRVPTPGVVSSDGLLEMTGGIPGYWMPPNYRHLVSAGSAPEVIPVSLLPTGAIHGTVVDQNGADLDGVMVGVVMTRRPSQLPEGEGYFPVGKNSSTTGDAPTRFIIQPLIFGGKYMAVASKGNTFVCSPAISITSENPIQEIQIRMPKTIDLTVQVLDDQNRPVARFPLHLLYQHSSGNGFGSPEIRTDEKGNATFTKVNPGAPGQYFVGCNAHRTFLPFNTKLKMQSATEIVHLRKGKILHGTLKDSITGKPVRGQKLRAFLHANPAEIGSFEAEEPTDLEGKFTFSTLAQGSYNFFGFGGGITPKEIRIQGNETNLTFLFEITKVIHIQNE